MKKAKRFVVMVALLVGGATAMNVQAQTINVDRAKYPDYSEKCNPDWSLMAPTQQQGAAARARTRTQRPDHVNNAETKHFPPVFNQDGGSCGSASRICYMFSYELAAYRDLDGSKAENYYPSHFVWLHTNSPSSPIDQGKDGFVTKVGVPSAATYGGQTYSSLFGYQEAGDEDFGWMQGYDKWYEAMHNRMLQPSNFPVNVGTEEGREAVKNWLWNHNGDDSFKAGGICGIGVASGGDWQDIPKTTNNQNIGVAGMKYVKQWGTQVDHALTIVGYDDRIEFDLDGDGVYGEAEADELGAWIIVNSWGDWCNGGFIYCPYAHGVPAFNGDGTMPNNFWTPEVYRVRKDYRPLRTIKLEMDYSRRSEIALSAGISADINATEPEKTVSFVHFTYAGDGNWGGSNPAPEIPMLGRWADGKLHTEPMEFGYDLTDLTEGYDMNQPLKYFFIIESREWAQGEGTIYEASIMDYCYDRQGIETPFGVGEGVEVRNAGEKTIVSVVVQGSSYYAPQNVSLVNNTLAWQAPMRSAASLAGYRIYADGSLLTELSSAASNYTLETMAANSYGISALYADGNESKMVMVKVPMTLSNPNVGIQLNESGFTIPGVFATKCQQATIEFWMKPSSLKNYNQQGGPGWGTFLFHANSDGRFTTGWNYLESERVHSNRYLIVDVWTHVAIVVDANKMTIYLDGVNCGSVTSSTYSGLGGFGDLVFKSSGNDAQYAVYDEIRIWDTARTEGQLKAYKNTEFSGSVMHQGLVAYFKGDLITDANGQELLRDCVGEHHATLQGSYSSVSNSLPTLEASTETPKASINMPTSTIYAGVPVAFTATCNDAVSHMEWTAEGAGIETLAVVSPTFVFNTAGTHQISVKATDQSGRQTTATLNVVVQSAPAPDATFTMTSAQVSAGERVTFHASNPSQGYLYQWSLPGGDVEEAVAPSVATCYQRQGTYPVTLTVTGPNGAIDNHTEYIQIVEVAPKANFSVAPAVIVRGEEVCFTDESLYAPTQWEWYICSDKTRDIVYDRRRTLVINKPGVYTVTLNAINNAGSSTLVRERAFIVTNADSKNGLFFSGDAAVSATRSPFSNEQGAFTIEWWMNSGWPAENINGIGDDEETLLLKTMGGGKMQLYVGGNNVVSSDDYVVPGEWHHYGVTYDAGSVKFYRDGVLKDSLEMSFSTIVPALGTFRLGGSAVPLRGGIDELRVWGRALTEEQLRAYANAPIADVVDAENQLSLKLYYDFNQSGGDVQDCTSNTNHGVRSGFGPDGDAWGLSRGVFCLNFEESLDQEVTENYLVNYAKSFEESGKSINSNLPTRTYELAEWTIENAISQNGVVTGAHVDRGKSSCLTVTTEWDGFATTLTDHKVFQTVTLPAGYYTFTAVYDDSYEGQCGSSYVVVAKGNTLPTTTNLGQAISYIAMKPKGQAGENAVSFLLARETTVSIGLLVNMSGKQCMTLKKFSLMRSEITVHEKVVLPLSSIYQLQNNQVYYVSQPNHSYGLTSWAVQTGGERLKSNHDLNVVPDKNDTRQQFAFITADGGVTYYLYHPAEAKFVDKYGALSATPSTSIKFKEGAFDETFVAYFGENHYINVGGSQQMVIDGWSTADGGNSCEILPVGEFDPTEVLKILNTPIEEEEHITSTSELDNNKLYLIRADRGSLAVERGGDALVSNVKLKVEINKENTQLQFALLSKDCETFYLYHVAEAMFVSYDGSLSSVPTSPIYIRSEENGEYVMLYFDETHYINMQSWGAIVIDSYATPDAGNCYTIIPVGEFDSTEALKAFDNQDTGVEKTTDNRQQATVIYDLQGRRVEKAAKGLYISNSKKMVIK